METLSLELQLLQMVHVLVSDANGLASWAAPSSLSGISDAATLGGLAATSFLRSDATTTYTSGTITFNSGTTVAIASTKLIYRRY
jgi:hypothetical protein